MLRVIGSRSSSAELYGRVRALADVLRGWGLGKGDRVAIISENRWEWPVTDFATLAIGGVDVPLYPTLTPEQIGYMLRDSGAKVAVVSSQEQYEKLTHAGDLPDLEHVVVMDGGTFEGAESFASLMAGAEGKQQRDAEFDVMVKLVQPEDLATIIYTSGTTGEPKGVMLTHGNLASNMNVSTEAFEFNEQDSCISFLPLSHVTARHLDYALMCYATKVAYCPKFDLLPAAMKAVQPTIFVAVPRVYEKIRQAVEGEVGGIAGEEEDSATGRWEWARPIGRRRWRERVRVGLGGSWRTSWCSARFARRLAGGRRCLCRAVRRWGWIRRGGLRMWGYGSSKGMG